MEALLITAHGSRKNQSNEEVMNLVQGIENMTKDFDCVSYAFIEFTPPSFSAQVDALADRGVTRIVVFPYFIAAGAHVLSDLPRLILQAKAAHPDIEFALTPHLGKCEGIKNLILEEVVKNQRTQA
jgi:sirohydrochlorin ferrochelatase